MDEQPETDKPKYTSLKMYIQPVTGQTLDPMLKIAAWLVIIFATFSLIYNLVTTGVSVPRVMVSLLQIGASVGLLYKQRGAYGVLLTLVIFGALISFLSAKSSWPALLFGFYWGIVTILLITGASGKNPQDEQKIPGDATEQTTTDDANDKTTIGE